MDRLWFHQCIQGFLSLAVIRTRDVHQFVDAHPYQSNIRLIEAQQDTLHRHDTLTIKSAFHLPDRSVLYHQDKNRSASSALVHVPSITPQQELALAGDNPQLAMEGKAEQPSKHVLKLLPVYVRPQHDLEAEDEEAETGWKDLEERLQEESPGDDATDEPTMSTGDEGPPIHTPPPSGLSIFDRFDAHIDASHFGVPEPRSDDGQRDFISWLTNLDEANQEPGSASEKKKKKKEVSKSSKKKNKAKKEAKRLAKQSVQKKRVVATETLAELLARQGHHQDAVDMYERLCLIYPEKKSIFAARIETIKSSHP